MAKKDDSSGVMWLAAAAVAFWLYRRGAFSAAPTANAVAAATQPPVAGGRTIRPLPPEYYGPPVNYYGPPVKSEYQPGATITLPYGQQPPKTTSDLYWAQATVGNPQPAGEPVTWTLLRYDNAGWVANPKDTY